ncbi:hypothetical protein ACIGNX_27625 [Actinosynnema sp. NPDC053489]|uniref:hypothetical protein n=1 Tax=Actinosynnema sp. NPDC053489 TaxID=3363916 RepID=UPI0037CACF94
MPAELITVYPLPFALLALVALVVAVLLWRLVVSAALTACGLYTLAAHGEHTAAVLAALGVLTCAALVLFPPARGVRRPVRMSRVEVAR